MNVATPDILAARVRRSIDKGIDDDRMATVIQGGRNQPRRLATHDHRFTFTRSFEESNHLSPTEAIVLAEQLTVDAIDLLLRESS